MPLGHLAARRYVWFRRACCPVGADRQWLDKNVALDMLHRFRAEDPAVTWRQVWLLVVFSLWHQIYVERVYDPVALGWEAPGPPDHDTQLAMT